jgi:peptide/nickel transport system substrate-binding protein
MCCAAAGLALVVAACGSGQTATVGTKPVNGGLATWAEQPGNWPASIFPFASGGHFSNTNINLFQYLMYRPLYWFGKQNQPTLSTELSLADPPKYNGQQITIKLKPNYHWSNGETVNAQDILFWMHMLITEKKNWGGYVPGAFPDNISDVQAHGADVVTMTIKGPYSQLWFTDNELSQISPMPAAWDRTATGASDCAKVAADCPAVWNYLNAQDQLTSSYATSKIWSIVDGPWKLKSFALDGNVVFTPNESYGGKRPAHHISAFEEEPFTTEQSEYNDLQAGSQKLDVGYLPTVDAPVPPSGVKVGENPLSPGYNLNPLYYWGLSYIPFDYANAAAGPIFKQLYFRQAFQYLVDQEGVINGPLHGYGALSVADVGSVPATKYLSTAAKTGDKYPLNPSAAAKKLKDNGWTVVPNGHTTCTSPGTGPGECGPHIARGEGLSFSIGYDGGISWVASAVRELASNASEVGMTITAKEGTFNSVTSQLGSPGKWQLLDWGGGWSYSPDYLPTGEELFQTGSVANFGSYSNATNDQLIQKTLHAGGNGAFYSALYAWENYLNGQLPIAMEPEGPFQLTETAANLRTTPQSPTLTINPEDWYFVK